MLLIVKNGLSFLSLLLSVLHSSGEPQIMGRREGTLRRIEEGSARKVLDWLRARRDDVRQAGRQAGKQADRQTGRTTEMRQKERERESSLLNPTLSASLQPLLSDLLCVCLALDIRHFVLRDER